MLALQEAEVVTAEVEQTKPLQPSKKLENGFDPEAITAFIRSDCPFPIDEDAHIELNKRKILGEEGNYTGIIWTKKYVIKFSTDQNFPGELELNKSVNKLFRKEKLQVRVPQLFRQAKGNVSRLSESPIVYGKFIRIKETNPYIQPKMHAMAIIKSLDELSSVSVDKLENVVLKKKDKQDYLNDVSNLFEVISSSLSQTNIDADRFQSYKDDLLKLFAIDSTYDLAQGLTHSDLAQHNMIVTGAGRVRIIDWEDAIEGSTWEDFARIFNDLISNPMIETDLDPIIAESNARRGEKNTVELLWDLLKDEQKYHTMLFVAYKSLYLLNHHLKHYKNNPTEERETYVMRNVNSFFTTIDYCLKNPDLQSQNTTFPFQDVVLTSTSLDILP